MLARKYRPATFADLIGQDVLVRVLSTALTSGRVAHAFLLTGVRGVGKTTTARILARALNCTGPDDNPEKDSNNAEADKEKRADPCGVCPSCRDIAAGTHVDVVEMDAASRTGVDDIRDIIEGAQYRPATARYRVYIIDEVHMLSKNAFNALLKTLEEPPAHVVFIFATTELRKVPTTVISRCQRFDLRRVEVDRLAAHLTDVAAREDTRLSPAAATLLARAAEGSVRDGLSLLDTAICATTRPDIDEADIRVLIGLSDGDRVLDLLDHVMAGRVGDIITLYRDLLTAGGDPEIIMTDLLELVHWLTRLRLTPELAKDSDIPEQRGARAAEMAQRLTMPVLSRAWQILLKGLEEARVAPAPIIAVEMALLRLACAADMPLPVDLVRTITGNEAETNTKSPEITPEKTPEKISEKAPEKTPPPPASDTRSQSSPTPSNQDIPSRDTPSHVTPSHYPPSESARAAMAKHPPVSRALEMFPGATITNIEET